MKALAALLALSLLAPRLSAAADESTLAARGRALYQGHTTYAGGTGVTALRLPAGMAACARCHGATGAGGLEGGLPVPPLRWSALQQPQDGRPALAGDAAVLQAITQGRGRGGAVLDATMPRFTLQRDEASALLAYLRRVGTERDQPPGVTEDLIRLGTVVPLSGLAQGTGRAIEAGLRAGFAEANARGGVHGRRIDLQVQDARQGVRHALTEWRAQPVFALVGGLWNEASERADPLLSQAHLSHLGTLVVREQPPRPADWSADLLASVALQRRALEQALQDCGAGPRLALTHGSATPVPSQAQVHWLGPQADVAAELRAAPRGCVAYTLPRAAGVQGDVPAGWSQTLVLPMPAVLLQPAASGEREDGPWYRLGLASARLTTELLSRAGRLLHERALLAQLDRVPELDISPGLTVQFGRQRRHAWSPLRVQMGAADASSAAALQPAMPSRGGG